MLLDGFRNEGRVIIAKQWSSMYALVGFARDGSCRLDAPGRSERSAVVRLLVVDLDVRPFMLEESRKSNSKASGLVVEVRLRRRECCGLIGVGKPGRVPSTSRSGGACCS